MLSKLKTFVSDIKIFVILFGLIVVASGVVYAKIDHDAKRIKELENNVKLISLEKGRLEDSMDLLHKAHEDILRENQLAQELVKISKEEVFLHLTELEALRKNLFKTTEKLPAPIKKDQDIVETEQKRKLVRARSELLWEAYCKSARDDLSCKDPS